MQPILHALDLPLPSNPASKHRVAFYEWGPADAADVVVCVHGLTRNARDFDALARQLAQQNRRVLCIDMAGRGLSEWLANPMDYHYGTYIADCLAILDNFHLRGVDWVGTSMGGIIGMMIAAQHPTRIRKLVLNDIGIHLSGAALQRIYGYVSAMPEQFASRTEGEDYLRQVFAPFGIQDAALWAHFFDHSLQPHPNGGVRLACDPAIAVPIRVQTNDFTDLRDISLAELWEKVSAATLIVRGAESDILNEVTVNAMRSSHAKAQSFTVPAVGHAPLLATPGEYQRVVDFLLYQDSAYSFI